MSKKIAGDRCPHCQRVGGFNVIVDPDAPERYKTCDYCKVSSPETLIFYVEYDEDEQDPDIEMDSIFEEQ